MQNLILDLDDNAIDLLRAHAASVDLPPEGVAVMAIVEAARMKAGHTGRIELLPANERLAQLADAFEKDAPKTQDEIAAFAEQLRYHAQFATTRTIPYFSGKKDA